MDAELCHNKRYLLLPSDNEEIGGVSGFHPHVELLQAIDIFIEIGQHFIQKLLNLSHSVDITRVSEHSSSRRILHLFTSIVNELAGRIVTCNGMVVFTSLHVITHLCYII